MARKTSRAAGPTEAKRSEAMYGVDALDGLDGVDALDESEQPDVVEAEVDASLSQPGGTVENGDAAGVPTYPEFLEMPKTKPTGGLGACGRPWVFSDAGRPIREPRAGDDMRPQCPNCSRDEVAVLCGANRTQTKSMSAVTWYYCPVTHCTFSASRLRKQIADAFVRQQAGGQTKPQPRPHITRP